MSNIKQRNILSRATAYGPTWARECDDTACCLCAYM